MTKINSLLENIGLTKSEIKVYLALLELGSSSTGPIVEKSGAASSKIYEVLEKLAQKGLVSFVIKSGVKHFEAASPKRLLSYLKEKQDKLKEQAKEVEDLIPELEMKQTLAENKSETVVFKGLEGAKTAFDNILEACTASDEFVATGFSDVDETFQQFLIHFHKKRVKHGAKFRAVFGPSLQKMVNILNSMPRAKVKVVPQMGNTVATLIYKDIVLFSMAKDRLWIQVKNQDLADTMKKRFENIWNQKIHIFEGENAIRDLFLNNICDFGDYVAFTEGMKIVNLLGEKNFEKWQFEKRKRGIKSRLIMGSKYKNKPTSTKAFAEFKFIQGYENVGATMIFNDKVLQVNFGKTPTAFLIEDKNTANSHKEHFEQLWNQDSSVQKGWGSLLETMRSIVDELQHKDTFDVLGAAFGINNKSSKYAKIFNEFDEYRQKKGIKARFLYQQNTQDLIKRYNIKQKNSEVKFLPYVNEMPVSFYPYNDKTMIMLQGEEPTTITINNKAITDAFKKQFEFLWNQAK